MRTLCLWILLAAACSRQTPGIVAHRALGVAESPEENSPANVVLAFQQGFGAEVDLRVDGPGCEGDLNRLSTEGCFDLGHVRSNGYTLADVLNLLDVHWTESFGGQVLLLDIANDTDRALTQTLLSYLRHRLSNSPLSTLKIYVQSSSVEGIALLRGQLEAEPVDFPLLLGITWFANPALTVPDSADFAIVHISELPLVEMPVPVGVFGVASEASYKQAVYAESEVVFVITDFPSRVVRFNAYD